MKIIVFPEENCYLSRFELLKNSMESMKSRRKILNKKERQTNYSKNTFWKVLGSIWEGVGLHLARVWDGLGSLGGTLGHSEVVFGTF